MAHYDIAHVLLKHLSHIFIIWYAGVRMILYLILICFFVFFFQSFSILWLFICFDYNTMKTISQMIGRATNDFVLCPIPVFQTSGRLTVPRTLHKREISPTEC